ncbi:hypothetical protein [Chitinimonas lacunae]|uniref:Uncharacterized protein n=1 Tax=Chitinimonas lacunae TaxID=1963018 RepID=A0ABV8MP08_9NEIS
MEGTHFFREIELIGSRGAPIAEFDEIDLVHRVIYEDKIAKGFGQNIGSDLSPAAYEKALRREITKFVDKKVVDKTEGKIAALQSPAGIRPSPSGLGTAVAPDLQAVQSIRNITFRFEGDHSILQEVMNTRMQSLQSKYSNYNFSAVYGYKPGG